MLNQVVLRRKFFDVAKWSLCNFGPAWVAFHIKLLVSRENLWTFTYHRVYSCNSEKGNSQHKTVTTPEEFDKELTFLGKHFNFVDGKTLRCHFNDGSPLPPRACLLTFDDAYEDLSEHVDAIMERHGAYGLVFVPPGFIETGNAYWWDLLQQVCFDYGRKQVEAGPWSAELVDDKSRIEAFHKGCLFFHTTDSVARKAFLEDMEKLKGCLPQGSPVLTWDALRSLSADRWGIGAHTITHSMLMDMSYNEQVREWIGAKEMLEEKIGREIWCAAYPYGEQHQLVDEMPMAVAEAGFKACFTQVSGTFGNDGNVFLVPRFGIAARDNFLLKISGVLNWRLWRPFMGASI